MNADLASVVPETVVIWCHERGDEDAAALCSGAAAPIAACPISPSTRIMMARKPNYDFERRERDRLKAEKKAKRAAEKKEAREEKARQKEHPEAGAAHDPEAPAPE